MRLHMQGGHGASSTAVEDRQHAQAAAAAADLADGFLAAASAGDSAAVHSYLLSLDEKLLHKKLPEAMTQAAISGHAAVLEILLTATNSSIRPAAMMSASKAAAMLALKAAVQHGHIEAVKQLLTAGFASLERGAATELLRAAIRTGNCDIVQLLIAAGALVSMPDVTGQPPLHVAVACGYTDMMQCLLAAGADMTMVDQDGASALETAARGGHAEVVEHLLRTLWVAYSKATAASADRLRDWWLAAFQHALDGGHTAAAQVMLEKMRERETREYLTSWLYLAICKGDNKSLQTFFTVYEACVHCAYRVAQDIAARFIGSSGSVDDKRTGISDAKHLKTVIDNLFCIHGLLSELTGKPLGALTADAKAWLLSTCAGNVTDLLFHATADKHFCQVQHMALVAAASRSWKAFSCCWHQITT